MRLSLLHPKVMATALIALAKVAVAADATFQATVQPVFDANCVACHQTGAATQGLNLEGGSSYTSIVNRRSTEAELMLVTPKSPASSYLLLKVLGTHGEAGGKGARMPVGGALTPRDIQAIRDWIAAGAKDD
jgi:mono/diheme cytochrome c family protein